MCLSKVQSLFVLGLTALLLQACGAESLHSLSGLESEDTASQLNRPFTLATDTGNPTTALTATLQDALGNPVQHRRHFLLHNDVGDSENRLVFSCAVDATPDVTVEEVAFSITRPNGRTFYVFDEYLYRNDLTDFFSDSDSQTLVSCFARGRTASGSNIEAASRNVQISRVGSVQSDEVGPIPENESQILSFR